MYIIRNTKNEVADTKFELLWLLLILLCTVVDLFPKRRNVVTTSIRNEGSSDSSSYISEHVRQSVIN